MPPLGILDSVGGLVAGAVLGLGVVWVAGAVLLQLPGQPTCTATSSSRRSCAARTRSHRRATCCAHSPAYDPFQQITGPAPPTVPPNRRVLASAGVHRARPSVVRIVATACGLGVEGSGWVARPHVVVTAAHVVAGARGILAGGHRARALVVDRKRRRRGPVGARPARGAAAARRAAIPATRSRSSAIPENGPFDARPDGSATPPTCSLDGSLREVTALRGLVRHGQLGRPGRERSRAGRVDDLRRARRRRRGLRRAGGAGPAARSPARANRSRPAPASQSNSSSAAAGRRNGGIT